MDNANSLLNQSKRDLAAKYEALVASLMVLWGIGHRMEDWRDPMSAVQAMQFEAMGRVNGQRNSTIARTPAPGCPACRFQLQHSRTDWELAHPLARHGYTKESGWTHPDLAEERNGR